MTGTSWCVLPATGEEAAVWPAASDTAMCQHLSVGLPASVASAWDQTVAPPPPATGSVQSGAAATNY